MKKTGTSRKQAALIAALIIGSATWLQAQANNPGQITQPTDTSTRQDRSTNLTVGIQSGQPMKVNRGSSLIGSTVKNQQGEKLGKIHDIVVDFNSERVAYAVLATDSGILQAEKLHAVPLRAFQSSADGTYLTLNADKDKLTHSEGFDKNNWPNLNTSTWGAEPFWKDAQSTDFQDVNQPTKRYKDPSINLRDTEPNQPIRAPK